jgi:hypothetical protein
VLPDPALIGLACPVEQQGDFFTSGTDNDQLSAFAFLKRKKPAKVDLSQDREYRRNFDSNSRDRRRKCRRFDPPVETPPAQRILTARKFTIIARSFTGAKLLVKFEIRTTKSETQTKISPPTHTKACSAYFSIDGDVLFTRDAELSQFRHQRRTLHT